MFVQELEYTIKESFANGMYDSCKNVMNPQTGKSSVELFCGSYASNCSAHVRIAQHFIQNTSISQNVASLNKLEKTFLTFSISRKA